MVSVTIMILMLLIGYVAGYWLTQLANKKPNKVKNDPEPINQEVIDLGPIEGIEDETIIGMEDEQLPDELKDVQCPIDVPPTIEEVKPEVVEDEKEPIEEASSPMEDSVDNGDDGTENTPVGEGDRPAVEERIENPIEDEEKPTDPEVIDSDPGSSSEELPSEEDGSTVDDSGEDSSDEEEPVEDPVTEVEPDPIEDPIVVEEDPVIPMEPVEEPKPDFGDIDCTENYNEWTSGDIVEENYVATNFGDIAIFGDMPMLLRNCKGKLIKQTDRFAQGFTDEQVTFSLESMYSVKHVKRFVMEVGTDVADAISIEVSIGSKKSQTTGTMYDSNKATSKQTSLVQKQTINNKFCRFWVSFRGDEEGKLAITFTKKNKNIGNLYVANFALNPDPEIYIHKLSSSKPELYMYQMDMAGLGGKYPILFADADPWLKIDDLYIDFPSKVIIEADSIESGRTGVVAIEAKTKDLYGPGLDRDSSYLILIDQ